MRFLPGLVIGAAVVLALTAEGCTDRACLEWNTKAEGVCPSQDDARAFFGTCSDVKRVLSAPTYLADEGGLCCYDVIHTPLGDPIPCHKSPSNTRSTGTSTSTSTTRTESGGDSTSTSAGPTSTGEGGSGGGAPHCETCDQALVSGIAGGVCGGSAAQSFIKLVTCGCDSSSCESSCSDFCSVDAPPSDACSSCLQASCGAELSSCEAH